MKSKYNHSRIDYRTDCPRRTEYGERGAVLIFALMVLVILTFLAMIAMFTATRAIEVAGKDRYKMEAFYVADAGLNRAVADTIRHYDQYGGFNQDPMDLNGDGNPNNDYVLHAQESPAIPSWEGITAPSLDQWNRLPDVYKIDYFTMAESCLQGYKTVTDACGGLYYEVWLHKSPTNVRLLSMARDRTGTIKAALEYIVEMTNNDICGNALVTGSNKVGHSVNGNIEVHGGFVAICDTCNCTNPAQCSSDPKCTAIEVNANTGIYNNYTEGHGIITTRLPADRIDALPLDQNGATTLNAKVLINNCNVSMGSSFELGASSSPMSKVIIDGGAGPDFYQIDQADAARIHTPPGQTFIGQNQFMTQLGVDAPTFPMIKNTNGPFTQTGLDIFDMAQSNNLYASTVTPGLWCNFTSSNTSLYYPPDCKPGINCVLYFNKATSPPTLTSYTDTTFDLSGCPSASMTSFDYSGKATFFYGSANVTIDGNVLVATGHSYPSDSNMAFITAGNLNIAPASQSNVMGLLYTQGAMTVEKQTGVAGIVIAKKLDVKDPPSNFFQAPNLDQNASAAFKKFCKGNERLRNEQWRVVY